MKKTTIALTILNVLGGILCSFYIFGKGFFSSAEALRAYPIFGVIIPSLACLIVGLLCTLLERKRNVILTWINSTAYATLYLFIGSVGLPEALIQQKWGLLVWLSFATITIAVSVLSNLIGAFIAKRLLRN